MDDFEHTTAPIIDAIRQAYDLKRINRDKDIHWTGPAKWPMRSPHLGAYCLSPPDALAAANLAYSEEDQGRDAITEIVGISVQLGIQKGYDEAAEEVGRQVAIATQLLEHAAKILKSASALDVPDTKEG